MSAKDSIDLDQLAGQFTIRAELAGREDARVFLAKRASDNKPVRLTVFSTPTGDKGNALSHLAADARQLAASGHPHVLGVLGGEWVGTESFAVVTEHPASPSLDELLTRRDEQFGFPRIAAILRQVNAALEWARGARVIHRAVRPDAIFVEPGSDHVRVMFSAAPLPADGMPGAVEDAAIIARLARAMMTRSTTAPERDRQPLAELRPGLPRRVVEQTESLLRADPEATAPAVDVSEYIASIAMADELKHGEVQCDRTIAEMTEEQRVTREQLAAERQAHEADLAEQARLFAQEKEEQARAFAREKEEAARALAKERQELQREIARERRALEKERARMEKEVAAFTRERASFQREVEKSRAQIAAKIAALDAHAQLYDRTSEFPAADREVLARERAVVADLPAGTVLPFPGAWGASPETAEPYDELEDQPADTSEPAPADSDLDEWDGDQPSQAVVSHGTSVSPGSPASPGPGSPTSTTAASSVSSVNSPWWRRAWQRRSRRGMTIAAAALVGVVGATSLALGRGDAGRDRPAPARIADSAAGAVAQPIVVQNLTPTTAVDTTPSEPAPAPRPVRTEPRVQSAPPPAPEPEATESRPDTTPLLPFAGVPILGNEPAAPVTPRDSTPTTGVLRDSVRQVPPVAVPPVSAPPVRRDSVSPVVPAVPTLPAPRDTTRPDSLPALRRG